MKIMILLAQEGNLLKTPTLDIKGLSIKKSTVNKPTRDFFTNILEEKILKDKTIDMSKTLSLFKQHETTVINEIMVKRNPHYLLPAKCNTTESYINPYSMSPLRGVIAWNLIYKDEQIRLPESVYKIPLKSGSDINSLEPLYKDNIEIFNIIKESFYDNENLSNFGFNVFCMPKDYKEIPEWILPLIDIEKIVSMSLSSAEVVLNSLGILSIKSAIPKSSSDKRMFLTNIIEF